MILPFPVLRQLDCVLEPSKEAVLVKTTLREGQGLNPEPFLLRVAGQAFCNTTELSMKRLLGDQDNIGENLRSSIQVFIVDRACIDQVWRKKLKGGFSNINDLPGVLAMILSSPSSRLICPELMIPEVGIHEEPAIPLRVSRFLEPDP